MPANLSMKLTDLSDSVSPLKSRITDACIDTVVQLFFFHAFSPDCHHGLLIGAVRLSAELRRRCGPMIAESPATDRDAL